MLGIKTAYALRIYNPLESNRDFVTILKDILTWGITIAEVVVSIMIVVAAFQMIMAQGKPEDFKKAQHTIVYAVIGLAILLIAQGIAAIVKKVLTG